MGEVTVGKHARMISETMSKLVYVRAGSTSRARRHAKSRDLCIVWEDDDMEDDDEIDNAEDMYDGIGARARAGGCTR